MVSDHIFPKFQLYARDFMAKTAAMPEFVAKEFAKAIYKAQLSDEQIKNGVRRFESQAGEKPFMPNPAEFVDLCREPVDAPGYAEAYREACRNAGFLSDAKWSSPAVYVAGKAVGWFELRNRPERDTLPRFKDAYKNALARLSAGENLAAAVPVAAIEAPRDLFRADLNTPGRLKALALLGRKP